MAGQFTRDSSGRVRSYKIDARYGAKLPGKARLDTIIRQAKRQGATQVGIAADVDNFQSYEQTRGHRHLVRAYRKGEGGTPDAVRARLKANPQPSTRAAILSELRAATGAESIRGLRGATINFYYGEEGA